MSLIVGIVGGIVGIALGVVRLPVMTAVGIDPLIAASTNLFVSVLGSIAGSWPAILPTAAKGRGAMLGLCLLMMMAAAMLRPVQVTYLALVVGGLYADIVSRTVLLVIVALLLLWSSMMLIIRATLSRSPY